MLAWNNNGLKNDNDDDDDEWHRSEVHLSYGKIHSFVTGNFASEPLECRIIQ